MGGVNGARMVGREGRGGEGVVVVMAVGSI